MLANFHTHTVFDDGKHTPEEIVLSAIEKGFSAIGFSGHGYTDFDVRYCMTDADGFRAEILRLKDQYRGDIQIYLGAEEDAFAPVDRDAFDYIIGSSHYFHLGDRYYPIDSGMSYFSECLKAFDHDVLRLAQTYYGAFWDYIRVRKPDIVGHFDLITKFDEQDTDLFLNCADYRRVAESCAEKVAQTGCLIEVNTGAISRGYRVTPYPSEHLLYRLKQLDARLILSSDSHHKDTIDFGFDEAKQRLREIGFDHLYTLYNGEFIQYGI